MRPDAAAAGRGARAQVATSAPIFCWRDEVALREAIKAEHNRCVAIAERSVVVGYEHALAAVTVTSWQP